MSHTITLLAGGTRGDVQPYVALAIGLRDAGYAVRLAAHEAFAPFVHNWGLEFVSLGENPSDLFYRAENQDALRAGKNPFHTLRTSYSYWQNARPVYTALVQNAWRAVQNSDALLFGLPTFWASALGAALQVPFAQAFMQPLTPTRAFPCPLLPVSRSLGATGNRLSYTLCFALMHWAWRDALAEWHKLFHIPNPSQTKTETPTLYGFSAHIVPRPPDLPPEHHITGYWFLPSRVYQPPDELESFLSAGDAPIVVGFGSAHARETREMTALLLRVQRATGLRFIIPHLLDQISLPRELFHAVGDVPHGWLFPRVRAVIHHGGAGTTAAALRAGIPQIIVPMYLDSYFWGARVYACGTGPRPLPESNLSARVLTGALEQLLSDKTMEARAQSLADAIAREQGIAHAVEHLRIMS